MGGFASALQGLGGVESDISQGRQQFRDQRIQDQFNQLALRENALKLAQIQSQLKDPEYLGIKTDPTSGATYAIVRDPVTKQIQARVVMPGPDLAKLKAQEQAQGEQIISFMDPRIQGLARGVLSAYGLDGLSKMIGQNVSSILKPETGAGEGTQSGQYTTADGKSGFGYRNPKDGKIYDAATGQVVDAARFVPSSMMPTPGLSVQAIQGPEGTTETVGVPYTKSKGGGVSIGTPIRIGQKALPAGVAEKMESMLATVQPFLEQLERMRDNVDVLDNPSSVAKIAAAASPNGLANLASHLMLMTDQEKQFAQDYINSAEGVNAIRTALQATGFRGPYAWEAMLQQRGNIFKRADINRGVLNSSIQTIRNNLLQALGMLGEQPNGDLARDLGIGVTRIGAGETPNVGSGVITVTTKDME